MIDLQRVRDGSLDAPRYVRVTRPDHHGYVEFQFTVGDADLALDMTLPPAAFAEFCAAQRARPLDTLTRAALRMALRGRCLDAADAGQE